MDLNDRLGSARVEGLGQSGTMQNLASAFAREAETLIRYRQFANTARHEGFGDAAELFARLAENQEVIVHGHLDFLRDWADPLTSLPLGTTRENVKAALEAELHDARDIYPGFSCRAESESSPVIASWFSTIAHAKDNNVRRIQKTLETALLMGPSPAATNLE
jgi:rubrerythrin